MNFKTFLMPEPGLAQHIFLTMSILSILSVASGVIAKISRNPRRIPPRCTNFAEIDAALSTNWDAFSEAVPGVLVVVGLLGTFFGLAQAISQAGLAIQTHPTIPIPGMLEQPHSDILSGLMPVLAGMGVKFKSSIWGISSSLVMRGFAHVFVRSPRKNEALAYLRKNSTEADPLQQAVASVCEQLVMTSDQILEASATQSKDLLALQGQQHQVMQEIVVKLQDMMQQMSKENSLQNLANNLGKMKSTLDLSLEEHKNVHAKLGNLDATAKALSTGAINISDAATQMKLAGEQQITQGQLATEELKTGISGAMNDFQDKVTKVMEQMTKDLQNATTGIQTSVDGLQSALNELKKETKIMAEAGGKQMEEGREALKTATENLNQGISKAMEGFQGKVTDAMATMTKDLKSATDGMNGAVAKSSKSLDDGVTGLTNSVGGLETRISEVLTNIGGAVTNLSGHMNQLNAQIEVMRQAAEQQKDANKGLMTEVEKVAQQAATIAQQVRAGERNNVNGVVSAVNDMKTQFGNVCGVLENLTKTFQESNQKSHAISENIAASLARLSEITRQEPQAEQARSATTTTTTTQSAKMIDLCSPMPAELATMSVPLPTLSMPASSDTISPLALSSMPAISASSIAPHTVTSPLPVQPTPTASAAFALPSLRPLTSSSSRPTNPTEAHPVTGPASSPSANQTTEETPATALPPVSPDKLR